MNARHLKPSDLAGKRWRGLVRESTERQSEGWSPARQREDLRRAAAELDLVPAEPVFYERTGSGEAVGAPELEQALADARAQVFDILLVTATSRFARNVGESRRLKAAFAKAGVIIYFTADRIVSGARATSLSEGIKEVVDAEENETRRFWIAGGQRQRQLSGRWIGRIPYGYRRAMVDFDDGTRGWDGALEVDPGTAPHVRLMFDRVTTGVSLRSIATALNNDGIRSPTGALWQHRTVHDIVQNPVYAGHMIRYRDRTEATYYEHDSPDGYADLGEVVPALVDPELWRQVQTFVGQRRYAGRHKWRSYPLSRVLRCAACGYRMTGANSREVRYYRCVGKTWYGVCSAKQVRAEAVEGAFARWLGSYRLPDDWRDEIARSSVREARSTEHDRQATLDGQLQRLRDLYRWGHIAEDEYRTSSAEVKAQMGVVTLPSIPSLEAVAAVLGDLGPAWLDAGPDEQAALPPMLLTMAEMRPDGVDWVVRPELRPLLELCAVLPDPSLTAGELEYDVRYSA